MIEHVLPAGVHAVESLTDRTDIDLFPSERAAIARSVGKRQREFTTVRACAREALSALGVGPVALVPGERGAPTWPDGVVGSMTHCAGYRAAVVAEQTKLASVGIDAEPNNALPDGVLETIALPRDLTDIYMLPTSAGVAWDRLLFSAKESVYKTWFPLTRCWLDFDEAEIGIDPDGTFTARLLVAGPVVAGREQTTFRGRWRAERDVIVTAIALPAS